MLELLERAPFAPSDTRGEGCVDSDHLAAANAAAVRVTVELRLSGDWQAVRDSYGLALDAKSRVFRGTHAGFVQRLASGVEARAFEEISAIVALRPEAEGADLTVILDYRQRSLLRPVGFDSGIRCELLAGETLFYRLDNGDFLPHSVAMEKERSRRIYNSDTILNDGAERDAATLGQIDRLGFVANAETFSED